MATFLLERSEAENKKRRRLIYFFALLAFLFVIGMCVVKETTNVLPAGFVFMASGIAVFVIMMVRDIGKVKFLEIGEEEIQWAVNDNNQPYIHFAWNDLQWIKKESNGSLTFFMASSFNYNLPVKNFSEKDQKEIEALITGDAHRRNIRLVNFSEPLLAVG